VALLGSFERADLFEAWRTRPAPADATDGARGSPVRHAAWEVL